MSNNIILKKSSVGDKVPVAGDLQYGELALNYADGNLFYKNSSNVVTTIASNKSVSVTGNVTGNYFIGNGSLLTGITASYGNANVAAYLPTYTGNLVGLQGNITTTANVQASYLIGNGSALTAITGANVTGTVANATYAATSGSAITSGTVTTAAQPNITSVGTLTSLVVTGNITGGNVSTGNLTASGSTTLSGLVSNSTVDFGSASNVSLGSISNIKISGGTANYVLQTDGASNLSWVAQSGGGGTPGGANTQIQFNDGGTFGGNAGLAFNKTTTTLTANNIVATSSANLGLVGNVVIGGGSNGYVLSTNGSGALSWIQPVQPASITVDNFTGNGVQTVFTLTTTPSSKNNIFVNYNGATLLQDAYSLTGANITFSSAPAAGAQLEITTLGLNTGGGGGGGGAIDGVFYENNANIVSSYTITSGKNAMTAGPVTINTGVTVTVPTGSRWVIV